MKRPDERPLTLDIRVSLRQENFGGPGLELHETVQLKASGFLEVCKVLARFDELARALKAEGAE